MSVDIRSVPIARVLYSLLLLLFSCLPRAWSLPWDVDMFVQPSYKAGEMVRAPVKGTVPIGKKPFTLTNEEASKKLLNPVIFGKFSVWRGGRLFNANCLTCHGETGKGDGPVGPQMGVPSLLDKFYQDREDGYWLGVLYNGGANMPRYGYKFSESEKWDLINYIRFLQGREVDGMTRPE